MAESEKKRISAPELPNVVKGDGRYLMSLLKDFLIQTAEQVNLANGFAADDVKPDDEGDVPTPRNFFLSFNRLGANLTWDHIPDVSVLAYYELRENLNVGNEYGLLDRTISNKSNKISVNYVGIIYLFAVSKEKKYSKAAQIRYTKPRPEAPTDIALTSNNEGTLITFLEIPIDCIGANVYVNDYRYQTLDNIFLFKHSKDMQIRTIQVAYYDVFGEGERGIVYCILPDVSGFLVERNEANLDFYWDALNVYGTEYVVKVSTTPEWDKALELFRTKNNKHRYVYPNLGQYYFLIKAMDERNNYSENATYAVLDTAPEIAKNIIIQLDQNITGYNGNKINLYYDVAANGLKLERDMLRGEYIVSVSLPQRYRARNWYDYKVLGMTSNNMRWCDMNFPWSSELAKGITWIGKVGDLNGIKVRQQISRYIGNGSAGIDYISFDGNLITEKGIAPTESVNANIFQSCRWNQGVYIDGETRISYQLNRMTEVFHILFYVKKMEDWQDCIFITLKKGVRFLAVGYELSTNSFFLSGSDGRKIVVENKSLERDWLTFGISQGQNERRLFVHSFGVDKTLEANMEAKSLGVLNELYCYAKIV